MSEAPLADVVRIEQDGREILLVGTAHISQESVETVKRAISEHAPDTVCVELDEQRYKSLKDPRAWQSLDLFQVIRKGQAPFLIANLVLSSYQKRMGLATGVRPGAELAAAALCAEEQGRALVLCDRNIRVTLLRAWRRTSFWRKNMVLSQLLMSVLGSGAQVELNEEEMRRLRQQDVLTSMLDEMAQIMPSVKEVIVDERDTYMAGRIQQAQGQKILAVVGAAHVPGITRKLSQPVPADTLTALDVIPEESLFARALPWLLPAVVVALFVFGLFQSDFEKVKSAALAWVLCTGTLSALGAAIGLAHPLTIATAFVTAPLTTLHPAIGVGFFTGPMQAWIAKPSVEDMERVGDDLIHIKGWWTNRLARVLIVFLFSSLGASAGTFLALNWLKDLL